MEKKISELTDEERKEYEKLLNRKAREGMKHKLMADILADLQVCELTGENPTEYLLELKDLIDGILKKFKKF